MLTVDKEIVDPKAVAFELKLELMSPWLDCAIEAGDDPAHCRRRTPGCDAVTRLVKRRKRVISMVMICAHSERNNCSILDSETPGLWKMKVRLIQNSVQVKRRDQFACWNAGMQKNAISELTGYLFFVSQLMTSRHNAVTQYTSGVIPSSQSVRLC